MKRFQSRRSNGRFQRNTLENCFGIRALVCAACRGFNTVGRGEPAPSQCRQCGAPFVELDAPEDDRR